MMGREIVVRIDVRAALLVLAGVSILLLSYHAIQPPKLETYILVDDTCNECMEGLRAAVNVLAQQGIELGDVEEVNVWGRGREILREINARVAPLVVFKGDVDPRIIPSTIKVGEYYVLRPTWPLRAFNPDGRRVDVYIHARDVYAKFLRYHIMRTVPNAVVHILPPERDYIVLLEVRKEDANIVRAAVKTDSVIHLRKKTLLGTKKTSKVAVDVFLTSFGEHSRKIVNILDDLKRTFGDHIRIIPHYRFVGRAEGYTDSEYCIKEDICAPGGSSEALQNLLETCVYIVYGELNWLAFAKTVQQCERNVQCAVNIAEALGMDINTIDTCLRGEGIDRALKDIALSSMYGISVVPTTFVGGWLPIVGAHEKNVYVEAICGMLRDDICQK